MTTEAELDDVSESLLSARGLRKRYTRRGGWSKPLAVQALDGVAVEVVSGSTVAVVGESGSGKSTLARCLALLERPDSGSIRFRGDDLLAANRRSVTAARRRIQMIFQDPASALDPRWTAAEIVGEPLRIRGRERARERRRQALGAMEQVGLLARWADRRPRELSGGQRQRLAIARALILEPEILILDEALSALDLSVQARIVNLLLDLQASRDLAYVFISHELSMVRYLADEVVVLQTGKVVERDTVAGVFNEPRHPHTRELLAATPVLERAAAGGG
ncbi:MAG: ATP-binding cassette domain-containing protein [bacterium]|nr:ATP-binding cassette domain-containing protein [bacterium]